MVSLGSQAPREVPVGDTTTGGTAMPRPPGAIRRRTLLGGAAGLAGTAILTGAPWVAASERTQPAAPSRSFTLGVASGDPAPDGVVLWTRLAPDPLAADGRGGMGDRAVPVGWEVAEDEGFRRVVARGTEVARPDEAHAVHAEVRGLRPGARYVYRFRSGSETSPVGRTKTAPEPGRRTDRFAFAFASCQNYPDGYYNAYAAMARDDLDLVAHLGDYIYESAAAGSIGRAHAPAAEPMTLTQYRVRHAQYKTDPDLQAAHAAFPWLVTFDDHEVENNWAGAISEADTEPDQDPRVFLQRRAQAFRAYYEHMPLRRAQRPNGPDIQIYRRLTFGDLMDFHVLDTRQFRDDQNQAARLDPNRTILGARQRDWLFRAIGGRTARWNVLAQQVFFSQRDSTPGPARGFSDDAWDNYVAERNAVRDRLARTSNPVVITGDVHANYVVDVKANFDDAASRTVATELVGTSISTGGNGSDQGPNDAAALAENPHIRFVNRNRGYVRNTVSAREWRADFRVVDVVSTRGAPARTRASFVVADGRPGARQV